MTSDEIVEAAKLAVGIRETMLDLVEPDMLYDERRWQLFLNLLRAADHELGKALSPTGAKI